MKLFLVAFLSLGLSFSALAQEREGGMRYQLTAGLTALAEKPFQGRRSARVTPNLAFSFETITRLQSLSLNLSGAELGDSAEQHEFSGSYNRDGPASRLSFDVQKRRIGSQAFLEESADGTPPDLAELSAGDTPLRMDDARGAYEFGVGLPLQGALRVGRQTRTREVSSTRSYVQLEVGLRDAGSDQLGVKLESRRFDAPDGDARQRHEDRIAFTFAKQLTVRTEVVSALGYAKIGDFGRDVATGLEGNFRLNRDFLDGQVFLSGEVSRVADGRIFTALLGGRGVLGSLEASGHIGITRLNQSGSDLAMAVSLEHKMPRAKVKFSAEQGLSQSADMDDTQRRSTAFGQYQYFLDPLRRVELTIGYALIRPVQGAENSSTGQIRAQYAAQIGRNWELKAGVKAQMRQPYDAERDRSVRIFVKFERMFEGVLGDGW